MEENYFSPQPIPFILCPWFFGQTADFILSYRLSCVPNDANLQQIPTPLTKVHGEQDIVQEHNLLPFEQNSQSLSLKTERIQRAPQCYQKHLSTQLWRKLWRG